jgi:hypothetical protein
VRHGRVRDRIVTSLSNPLRIPAHVRPLFPDATSTPPVRALTLQNELALLLSRCCIFPLRTLWQSNIDHSGTASCLGATPLSSTQPRNRIANRAGRYTQQYQSSAYLLHVGTHVKLTGVGRIRSRIVEVLTRDLALNSSSRIRELLEGSLTSTRMR